MNEATTPSTSSNRPISRYLIGAVLASLLLAATTVGIADTFPSSQFPVRFGCPGTMVIHNVDCEMGVATAFDIDLSNGLAPWCDGKTDTTVYGCSDGSVTDVSSTAERERDRRVRCHQHVPSLHPDGAMRALEERCAGDAWVDKALVALAEARVFGRPCLALALRTPACVP